jgi:hypothetical protein
VRHALTIRASARESRWPGSFLLRPVHGFNRLNEAHHKHDDEHADYKQHENNPAVIAPVHVMKPFSPRLAGIGRVVFERPNQPFPHTLEKPVHD